MPVTNLVLYIFGIIFFIISAIFYFFKGVQKKNWKLICSMICVILTAFLLGYVSFQKEMQILKSSPPDKRPDLYRVAKKTEVLDSYIFYPLIFNNVLENCTGFDLILNYDYESAQDDILYAVYTCSQANESWDFIGNISLNRGNIDIKESLVFSKKTIKKIAVIPENIDNDDEMQISLSISNYKYDK